MPKSKTVEHGPSMGEMTTTRRASEDQITGLTGFIGGQRP